MTIAALHVGNTGTEITRFNALKHGILSRYTVLPWEDADEYSALVGSLAAEHAPEGPTEEHLVEELAGILWRKRRLRLSEAALYRRGLDHTLSSYRETAKIALVHLKSKGGAGCVEEAIRNTSAEMEDDIADLEEDEAMTRRALNLLDPNRIDAYEAALVELREDTREWWGRQLGRGLDELEENEKPASAGPKDLRDFLEREVMPWFENRRKELTNRPLIREQAFGEALNPDKLEQLGRYEVHLDRKLERMLSMLIKLKDIRCVSTED